MKHLILLLALILPLQGCVEIIVLAPSIAQAVGEGLSKNNKKIGKVHREYIQCIETYEGDEQEACVKEYRKKYTSTKAHRKRGVSIEVHTRHAKKRCAMRDTKNTPEFWTCFYLHLELDRELGRI